MQRHRMTMIKSEKMGLTKKQEELFDAFLAGFQASGEGFNAEYPFGDAHSESDRGELSESHLLRERFIEYVSAIRKGQK